MLLYLYPARFTSFALIMTMAEVVEGLSISLANLI